jgi:DNA-binding beta-propeller fold protein YncE
MRLKLMFWLLLFLFIGFVAHGHATVEWDILQKIEIDTQPIDVAISPDGKRIFVLNDKGEVLVYSRLGKLEDRIAMEKDFDQIKVGPRGDLLYLKSRKNKTIEIVELDFIQNINISGSPYKGPEDAPVVIAVFDDFQ